MRFPTVGLGSRDRVWAPDESIISDLDASMTPMSGRDGSGSQIAAQIAAASNKRALNSVARESEVQCGSQRLP